MKKNYIHPVSRVVTLDADEFMELGITSGTPEVDNPENNFSKDNGGWDSWEED